MLWVSDYQVMEIISENSKKAIYRCLDASSKEKVVLKVLKAEFATYEEVMRFKREYKILVKLSESTEGVLKPVKMEELNGIFIIVMEDIGGKPLKSILADEKLNMDVLLHLAVEIVKIVSSIHDNQVIHKDLKPSNIIWNNEKNIVKIIDFDLAIELSKEKHEYPNTGILEGAFPYISPEQTGRINRCIDYRTDFYSFGVILYELLTGQKPYEASGIIEQVYSVIVKEPVSPYELTKGRIPKPLSDIIMKLLEKSPEHRYRSSYGIIADLRKCINRISDFKIGENDRLDLFQIPQKLYGREAELTALKDAFDVGIKDDSKLVLISGDAGIGKTTLVNEFHRHISQGKSFFIEGKFDQYNRNSPYSAIIQAFRKLMVQLSESEDQDLDNLKNTLVSRLGNNGGLITNIIPELERLIGVQPQIGQLNPVEETNRFFITFANFVEGITNNENPLVLFLDDLQWADLSSIKLLEKLILNKKLSKILVICCYRQNEVNKGHPFIISVTEIEKLREVKHIYLQSLSVENICSLISETLYSNSEMTRELASVVFGRSRGNPFFANEILKDLYRNGQIFFDDSKGFWCWDIEKIKGMKIPENIVQFLILKIKNLSEEVQQLLSYSAALGNVFDFKMLSLVSERDTRTVAQSLIEAVNGELIFPRVRNYHILPSIMDEKETVPNNIDITFMFQHDRILQALYQMIDDEAIKKLHYRIGKILLEQLSVAETDEKIIDIAAHLNKGIDFVSEGDELDTVVSINLKAAKRVKAAFGYDPAFDFLETAIGLLRVDSWSQKYEETFEIYKLYSECAYLTQRVEAAQKACGVLLTKAKTNFELAMIYEMQANHYTYLGMMKESIEAGKLGLKCLGIKIPKKVSMGQVLMELIKVKMSIKGRTTQVLLEGPEIKDERLKLIMRLLVSFIPPAFISGEQNLFALAVLKKTFLTTKYGNCPESAGAYIGYAILLSGLGDVKGAYDFGRLAIKINEHFNDLQWKSMVYVLYTLFCHTWNEPWETLEGWYQKAIDSSLKSGDLLYLAHACYYVNLWNPDLDIERYLQESERYLSIIENTKYNNALATARLARQKFLSLAGALDDVLSFDDVFFKEAEYLKQLTETKYYSGIAIYYLYKLQVLFTYGKYEEALEYIYKADKIINTLVGSAFMEEFSLYTFLNLSSGYEKLSYFGKIKAKVRMRKEYKRMKKWAEASPENFLQQKLIMEAELARISDENEKAEKYYNLAIVTGEKGNFLRYKALANELAGKFYYHRGLQEISFHFIRQAAYYYSVWGAKGKVKQFEQDYPEILGKINMTIYQQDKTTSTSTENIDIHSIVMASQAISKEIELDNLLEALMEIVIKNAGAQRGCIVMKSNSNILVEGEYQAEEDIITVMSHDIFDYKNLPKSMIDYVTENKETIIYDDAFSATQFSQDPYILEQKPQSLLCMPLLNQNIVTAIIYLENNLISGAFTKERLKIINLLSREMVFSLENASLYTDLERSEEQYRMLVNNMMDGILIIQDQKLVYVNEAMANILGYEIDEMTDKPLVSFVASEDLNMLEEYHLLSRRDQGGSNEQEIRLLHKKSGVDVIAILKIGYINYMKREGFLVTVKDITERKKAEEELRRHRDKLEELVAERTKELELKNEELNKYIKIVEQISITDGLTGLYNRRYFNDIFSREVNRAKRNKSYLAFIMLDVDYFKHYNDTYRHYEGDNVLRKLGSTIKEYTKRSSDYTFRLGGEEFGIVISRLNPEQTYNFAENLRRGIEELRIPNDKTGVSQYVTISIGVAVAIGNDYTEEDIYKLADDALYRSKDEGKNCVTMLFKEG